ncbi:uncharacterized protein LOC122810527 [Protopterus annectens]|uniref:uncharacterized protein LOC122810527 n=1 Tax=Protopterus annectens TaxID=7888 RepID=UPI001CF9927E|nr:uncharacterized protein LOC122810527 [Protopterus annectens]
MITLEIDFFEECSLLKDMFVIHGYPDRLVEDLIDEVSIKMSRGFFKPILYIKEENVETSLEDELRGWERNTQETLRQQPGSGRDYTSSEQRGTAVTNTLHIDAENSIFSDLQPRKASSGAVTSVGASSSKATGKTTTRSDEIPVVKPKNTALACVTHINNASDSSIQECSSKNTNGTFLLEKPFPIRGRSRNRPHGKTRRPHSVDDQNKFVKKSKQQNLTADVSYCMYVEEGDRKK